MEPTALGTDFFGFLVSQATKAEFSEPAIAKMQVGITDRKPLNPFVKPPVEFQ